MIEMKIGTETRPGISSPPISVFYNVCGNTGMDEDDIPGLVSVHFSSATIFRIKFLLLVD